MTDLQREMLDKAIVALNSQNVDKHYLDIILGILLDIEVKLNNANSLKEDLKNILGEVLR